MANKITRENGYGKIIYEGDAGAEVILEHLNSEHPKLKNRYYRNVEVIKHAYEQLDRFEEWFKSFAANQPETEKQFNIYEAIRDAPDREFVFEAEIERLEPLIQHKKNLENFAKSLSERDRIIDFTNKTRNIYG